MKPIAWGVLLLPIVLAGCNGGAAATARLQRPATTAAVPAAPAGGAQAAALYPVEQREAELTSALAAAPSEVDFSLSLQRSDGRRYNL